MFNLMFKSGGGDDKIKEVLLQRRKPSVEPSEPVMGGRGLVKLSPLPFSREINDRRLSDLRRLEVAVEAVPEVDLSQKTAQFTLEDDGPFSNIMLVGNNNLGMQH